MSQGSRNCFERLAAPGTSAPHAEGSREIALCPEADRDTSTLVRYGPRSRLAHRRDVEPSRTPCRGTRAITAPVAQKDNNPVARKLLPFYGLNAGLGIGHHEDGCLLTHTYPAWIGPIGLILNTIRATVKGFERSPGSGAPRSSRSLRMRTVALKCLEGSQSPLLLPTAPSD